MQIRGDTMPLGPAVSGGFFKGLVRFTPDLPQEMAARHGAPLPWLNASPLRRRAPRRPRIVFLVMSAVAKPQTVEQLAQALAPHQVLVHHDFSQSPDFALQAGHVRFVPRPVRTGWASFGFVQAIFHSLEHALRHLDFDYLQLLSPSCLPIKPMAAFERHVSGMEEAHFDCVDLLTDPDALRCVGYRAWTAEGSRAHRLARQLVDLHYGASAGRREEAGIWLRSGADAGLRAQLAGLALTALQHPALGRHLRQQRLRLYYGSAWFGARKHVVAGMARAWRQPGLQEYFRRVRIAEEFLIPSLLMKLSPHKGPLNHLIQRFDQAHPGLYGVEHLDALRQSPAFFARKFPDDPHAAVRQHVLSELVQRAPGAAFSPSPATRALA